MTTLSITLLSALVAVGCGPSLGWHGRSGTLASYNGLELSAKLPPRMDVATVAAAGEAALLSRGYVITRREGTQGRSTIVAKSPAAGLRRHIDRAVVFTSVQRKQGIAVDIHIRPIPNEAESRALLEATLAQLGM